jgi:hypothetical protein
MARKLNSLAGDEVAYVETVGPCTFAKFWSVYHGMRQSSFRRSPIDTMVSSSPRAPARDTDGCFRHRSQAKNAPRRARNRRAQLARR